VTTFTPDNDAAVSQPGPVSILHLDPTPVTTYRREHAPRRTPRRYSNLVEADDAEDRNGLGRRDAFPPPGPAIRSLRLTPGHAGWSGMRQSYRVRRRTYTSSQPRPDLFCLGHSVVWWPRSQQACAQVCSWPAHSSFNKAFMIR
jgi:hypothetical protein